MKNKKKQVYSELLNLIDESTSIKKEEVGDILKKSLVVPAEGNNVIWNELFNDLQQYGEKLSLIKNFLEGKVTYWKTIFDLHKDRFKGIYKSYLNSEIEESVYVKEKEIYDDIIDTHIEWKYFFNVTKDKWALLDRAIGQLRSLLTTERELVKKGIS